MAGKACQNVLLSIVFIIFVLVAKLFRNKFYFTFNLPSSPQQQTAF